MMEFSFFKALTWPVSFMNDGPNLWFGITRPIDHVKQSIIYFGTLFFIT